MGACICMKEARESLSLARVCMCVRAKERKKRLSLNYMAALQRGIDLIVARERAREGERENSLKRDGRIEISQSRHYSRGSIARLYIYVRVHVCAYERK